MGTELTTRPYTTLQQAEKESPLLRYLETTGVSAFFGTFICGIFMICAWAGGVSLAVSLGLTAATIACAATVIAAIYYDVDTRHREQLVQRRQTRLNAGLPWQPREGEPHPVGRSDTYDRWRIEVQGFEDHFSIGLRRWTYQGAWRQRQFDELARVDADDTPGLGDARAEAEAERDRREQSAREAHLVKQGMSEAAARAAAIRAETDAERAERIRRNQQLAAQLSE